MPPFCTRRIVDWYAFNATPLPSPRPVHRLPLGRRLCVQEYFLNTSYVQRWIQSGKLSLFGESRRSLGIVQSLSGKLHGKENQYSENFCYPLLLPDFCRKAVLFFFLLVCSAKGYRTFSIHHFASLFLSSCLPENFSFFI